MRYSLFVVLILTTATVSCVKLNTLYEWKYVDFRWKNEKQKELAINSGKYNRHSCVLYDLDRAPDGRLFVTVVKEEGVPASLMTVSDEIGPGGPLLDPYPDWSWYENNDENNDDCNNDDCNNKIINVYRVSIKCNHLFVLDCGKVGEIIKCPPKLLIFNLGNDMLVNSITIPPHIANNKNGTGLLVTPLAHVRDCNKINDMTVFMADIKGYGLAIYYEKMRKSCFSRIESTFMKPTNPNFTIQNQSFYLEDGILGLTNIHKDLFYSPLAGNNMYKINMCKIQKCSKLKFSKIVARKNKADDLTQLAGTLSGQTGPIASEKCAIFFSNVPETSILCQDATKEFNSTNTELIAQDSEKLQFPSGMKTNDDHLMILTNRFQRFMTNTLNLNEINFRILAMNITQIWKETNCFASCSDDHSKPQSEHHKH